MASSRPPAAPRAQGGPGCALTGLSPAPRTPETPRGWAGLATALRLDVSPIDRHRTLCATEPASLAQSGSVSAWKLYSKGWCSVSWRQ